jgi:hypothetical protein
VAGSSAWPLPIRIRFLLGGVSTRLYPEEILSVFARPVRLTSVHIPVGSPSVAIVITGIEAPLYRAPELPPVSTDMWSPDAGSWFSAGARMAC